MDNEQDVLMEVFVADSQEYAGIAEGLLMKLEQRPGDKDALASLFRMVHTIKGDAAMVGQVAISHLAHQLEDFLDDARSGKRSLCSESISILLSALDVIKAMLSAVGERRDVDEISQVEVLQDLHALMTRSLEEKTEETRPESAEESSSWDGSKERRKSTLRVEITKLDRMLEILGEIAAGRSRINRELRDLGERGRGLLEAQSSADRLHSDLHELVLRLRMVPIEPVLGQYNRTVRDLAHKQKKRVKLLIDAGEVEVDTSVVERLREPLTHLVRNAVDHGIETPRERERAGKSPEATIRILATHEMSHIVIRVSDDGRGINEEKVLARGQAMDLWAEEEAPEREELLNVIFQSGFTTAESVSEVSGRGVGMDAVVKSVQSLRGTVSVESEKGKGTAVTLRIPLTLARGFVLEVAGGVYVVPLESVVECIQAPEELKGGTRLRGVMDYRDGVLPYVRLRAFFGMEDASPREDVIVVKQNGLKAGLLVDRLRGEAQTASQPLHQLLQQAKAISGASVLEDGSLALLLDVSDAIKFAGLDDEPDRDLEYIEQNARIAGAQGVS